MDLIFLPTNKNYFIEVEEEFVWPVCVCVFVGGRGGVTIDGGGGGVVSRSGEDGMRVVT